jgi:CheY-like chemotaxis protein
MRRKLLLADDSVTIQRVIELTFADEDVQVLAVGDGKKAIASIEQDRPDIVLADVGMPERDGYEVAAFIKGNPQLANIPVLLLTGAFEPIDETRARAVGCDGVLVKPFEPQMVINRVKDLLAGRRPAGLWGASPTAHGPTRHAPPEREHTLRAATSQSSSGAGGSLEDYFDRLDAAFANLEATPESAPVHSQPAAIVPPPPMGAAAARPPMSAPEATGVRGGAPPAAVPSPRSANALPPDVLDGWDPDLEGDPKRVEPLGAPAPITVARTDVQAYEVPAAAPPPPAAQPGAPMRTDAPLPSTVPPPAASSSTAPFATPEVTAAASAPPASPAFTAPAMPSLAEAFAALLSAEQSRLISPAAPRVATVSDDTIDDIVRRVAARMSEQAVRETVLDVAERLVREEIDRIKGAAHNS